MTRWCSAPNAAGVALAAAIGLSPMPGLAQTAGPGSDLLQPSLDGNPANPPRFHQPGEVAPPSGNRPLPPGTFTATSRLGATPIYGSPAGFGAGDTGFDSKNTPRRKKLAQTPPSSAGGTTPQPETTFAPVPSYTSRATFKPAAPKKPPPTEIHPNKAATRTGAVLPPPSEPLPLSNPPPEVHPLKAANRPGAVLPVPPPQYFDYAASTPPPTTPQPNTLTPGTVPQRPLPLAAGDPYAALGIRAGSFLLLPSLDLTAGYNTNPERVTGAGGAPYFIAAPALQVRSDWERHSLTADISGSYIEYGDHLVPSLDVPYFNSKIDGRIDVSRDTQIIAEGRYLLTTDNPGSPNLQAGLAQLPIDTDLGGTLGVIQTFNRLSVALKGTADRAVYDDSLLTNGELESNTDRNFNQYAGIMRIGYELDPGLKPFVELEGDERIHDEQFDRSNLQRDSVGASGKVGAAVDLFGSLTGEMAVGYVERTYQDPTLPNVSGVIADGSLLWQATPLTSAKLTATSQVYETVIAGASGELSRDVNLQIDHAFQYWLVGTLKGGYGNDNYVGVFTDNRYFVSVGLAYKLTREMQIRTELRQDWLTTTEPGFSYTATTALIGLRLQR